MSENRFQNKYRIPSSRAEWHSYEGGGFFVTVCTQYRQKYFGEIECGEMRLSELGKYLAEQIVITPQMRSDMNVEIPSFVIMPNHVHMIVVINVNEYNALDYNAVFQCRDAMHCVSTTTTTTMCNGDKIRNRFSPQSKNLASVVRGIKIATTVFARKNNIPFAWQTRYYDRIIRNTAEMNRIAWYIENNVAHWEEDENHLDV